MMQQTFLIILLISRTTASVENLRVFGDADHSGAFWGLT